MSELRKNPLTNQWVIVAGNRHERPGGFSWRDHSESSIDDCPFESGKESRTPPEIDAIRPTCTDVPDWSVRVVPNKYNALSPEEPTDSPNDSFFQSMPGAGSHEVVIESPDHQKRLADFSPEQYNRVLKMIQRRLVDLLSEESFPYVQVFRNEGPEAGASLSHPHSQILTFPRIPEATHRRIRTGYQYFSRTGDCVLCEEVTREKNRGDRIVESNKYFTVLCPYASRFPYEITIVPDWHHHDFRRLQADRRYQLAKTLTRTMDRLGDTLDTPPSNLLLYTAPDPETPGERDYLENMADHSHWFLKIVPRIKRLAGLELAVETHINSVQPEKAAEQLRDR